MSFIDLNKQARMLCDAGRLESVWMGLKKIRERTSIDKKTQEDFKWVGKLVSNRDLSVRSLPYPELSEIATTLRSSFHGNLVSIGIEYETGFCQKLSKYLESPERVELTEEELEKSIQLFQGMESELLGELQSTYRMGRI